MSRFVDEPTISFSQLILPKAAQRKQTIWKHQHNANNAVQTETSWGNQVYCVYVKEIQKYFRNANKPLRMVWWKLYKISISQLYECENQMGSLFWAIAIQAFGQGHLSAWRVCNARDHTHAHADLLIIYANFPPINPQCTPSPVWRITKRIALRGTPSYFHPETRSRLKKSVLPAV